MKNIFITLFLLVVAGCSSDQQSTATGSNDMQSSVIGEWQYAGGYGEKPDARIPGFLKEHGYIFSTDGKWKSPTRSSGSATLRAGEYSLNGDQLTISGKSIIGGSKQTKIMFEDGNLIMLTDISISKHDQPSQTRYRKVQ